MVKGEQFGRIVSEVEEVGLLAARGPWGTFLLDEEVIVPRGPRARAPGGGGLLLFALDDGA